MNLHIKLSEIQRIADELRPLIGDDEQCFADMIEGETDAGYLVQLLHDQIAHDGEMVTGIKAREAELKGRRERLEARVSGNKAAIGKVLRAASLSKWELPEATYSVRDGKSKIAIVDKDAVPIEFQRATYAPDKTAINESFANSDALPNWLVREPARDVVTARTK